MGYLVNNALDWLIVGAAIVGACLWILRRALRPSRTAGCDKCGDATLSRSQPGGPMRKSRSATERSSASRFT